MARRDIDPRLASIVEEHVRTLADALAEAIRANIAIDIDRLLAKGEGGLRRAPGRPATKAKKARKILPCIAPGCGKPSKGPRFRFLCDDHKGASKKDVEEWRMIKKGITPGTPPRKRGRPKKNKNAT